MKIIFKITKAADQNRMKNYIHMYPFFGEYLIQANDSEYLLDQDELGDLYSKINGLQFIQILADITEQFNELGIEFQPIFTL